MAFSFVLEQEPHEEGEVNGMDGRTVTLDSLDIYVEEFRKCGTALVPPDLIFSADELEHLNAIQSRIPEEKVSNGDAGDTHDIYVRRIMTDKPGEIPTLVNRPFSDQILEIIGDEKRQAIFSEMLPSPSDLFIRRGQMNRMIQDSFIGLHLDAASNPDYEFSVVIQLGRDFKGGEFVVYPDDGEKQIFFPTYGSVLISTCKLHHEVWKVLANERNSLVYFYSRYGGVNRREVPTTSA